MRAFLLFLIYLFFALNSKAQNNILNQKISIKLKNVGVVEILKSIEEKTNVKFSYNLNIFPNKKMSITIKDETLEFILAKILTPYSLNFTVFNQENIVINKVENPKKKHTISGYVIDKESGEKLIDAAIVNTKTLQYTVSNKDGFFSISLIQDSISLEFSFIGYESKKMSIYLNKNLSLTIELKNNFELPTQRTIYRPLIGIVSKPDEFIVNSNTIKKMPSLFGESDVLKSLQLIPGVLAGNDGSISLNIRGSGNEHNLYLLDDVPLYNPSHIYGFFSVFNSDIVKNVKLIKGGMNAEYGGRLGSVIDVRTIDGNKNYIKHKVSIGLLSSKFALDGPLNKSKKTTFMVSARRTYFDLYSKTLGLNNFLPIKSNFFFYDFNIKINHEFNKNNKLSAFFYKGIDNSFVNNTFKLSNNKNEISETNKQNVYWGNQLVSLRYIHNFTPKLSGKLQFASTTYNFGNDNNYSYNESRDTVNISTFYSNQFLSEIIDNMANYSFEYKPNSKLYFKSGIGAIQHLFKRTINSNTNTTNNNDYNENRSNSSLEINAFTNVLFKVNSNLELNAGLYFSNFNLNSISYYLPQPRASINYLLNKKSVLHAAYQTTAQFLHLLTNSITGVPTDLWLPSTIKAPPEFANLYSLGYQVSEEKWGFNVEGFYKNMFNVLDYKEQANYLGTDNNWDDKIVVGTGESYGIEIMLEKKSKKTNGWISYTLSKSERTFKEINQGKAMPFRFDRRHNLVLFINRDFSRKLDAFLNWNLASGSRVTLPEQIMYVRDANNDLKMIYIYGDRNKYQLPLNHRLDIGVNYKKYYKRFSSVLSIGVYNVYNHLNPFYVTPIVENNGKRVFQGVSLFPVLPSINYKALF